MHRQKIFLINTSRYERTTRISTFFENLTKEDRLHKWNLKTLEERRVRGEPIQMYKVKNNIEQIEWYTGPRYVKSYQTRVPVYLRNNHQLEKEKNILKIID